MEEETVYLVLENEQGGRLTVNGRLALLRVLLSVLKGYQEAEGRALTSHLPTDPTTIQASQEGEHVTTDRD